MLGTLAPRGRAGRGGGERSGRGGISPLTIRAVLGNGTGNDVCAVCEPKALDRRTGV